MSIKHKILFLCSGNSCRSQMAEAWTRELQKLLFEPFSAGIEPKGIDPRAVVVMKEVGIDISNQRSKAIDEINHIDFDYVVTVCDHAFEACPFFPSRLMTLHKGFNDPPRLAEAETEEQKALDHYRKIRDEIRKFIEELPGKLNLVQV